mmetsp:Transcript_36731/g.83095  ORF Transcript_36731/g.83095 Transcript_36731/m.83095 type:complete len:249 (+) Transcript_36731:898-1644(+)
MPLGTVELLQVYPHIVMYADGACSGVGEMGILGNVGVVRHVVRLAVLDVQEVVPPLLSLLHGLPHLVNPLEDLHLLVIRRVHAQGDVAEAIVLPVRRAHVSDDGPVLEDLDLPDPQLAQEGQAHGLGDPVRGLLQAKRVVLVAAPGVDHAAGGERKGGVLDHGDLGDVLIAQPLHLCGFEHVHELTTLVNHAVAQLALGVVAPAVDLPDGVEGDNVVLTHLDVCDIDEAIQLFGHVLVDNGLALRVVP